MTTFTFISKECFICGKMGHYADIGIYNIGKPEDLDGRSVGPERSSIYILIKRCISCGYCSPEISGGPPQAAEIINDSSYKKQLIDRSFPDTANAFLCWSIIQNKINISNEACRSALYAAWICDDSDEHRDKAIQCRKYAIKYLKKAQSLKQSFCKTKLDEQLLLIDLYRRCGLFKEASGLCKQVQKKSLPKKEEMVLLFQEDLINSKDKRKHTISEAFVEIVIPR